MFRDDAGSADVLVVGGGVIGLSCAWLLARGGAEVTVVDPAPGQGTSYVGAGMLAAVTEHHIGDERGLDLAVRSAARWASWAPAVEAASGLPVGYRTDGTLVVAVDDDDRAELGRVRQLHDRYRLPSQSLTTREARTLEPLVAPGISAALLVQHDTSVHNRLLLAALQRAARDAGVRWQPAAVETVLSSPRGVTGVRLVTGAELYADTTVVATGVAAAGLPGLRDVVVPVRAVRGEILRLATTGSSGPVLTHTLRALVHGYPVYLVPRADGEVVVGATTDERGQDVTVSAGGVFQLLRDARAVLPVVGELQLVEARAGLRPVTPDHVPLVGPAGPGLVLATGHGRNGILQSPTTADAVAGWILDGTLPDDAAATDPLRFTPAGVRA
ncbi:MAG: glycine oxidase ThiO [Actinomycetota bacterium]|nr:MAG: glycine oxidase ThiO [Actinomycetota bacterium]